MEGFDATGNAVFAVRAFVEAEKLGVYPPQRIMRWVSRSFEAWAEQKGKRSMDKAMRLTLGRGKTSPYGAALLHERNEHLIAEIDLLKALGATQEQAQEMVESRLDHKLKRDRLIDILSERKTKYWTNKAELEELKADPEWHEWLRARLQAYNPLCVPEALQSMV